MTDRSITHASFTITRDYAKPRARVYAAFSDFDTKSRWFTGPEDDPSKVWEFDFRVGGREFNSELFMGAIHTFDSTYHDIVPDERIVYSYTMIVDNVKLSASLTTLEFEAIPDGTRLTLTEHGAFFDGHEDPKLREDGTRGLLDAIEGILD